MDWIWDITWFTQTCTIVIEIRLTKFLSNKNENIWIISMFFSTKLLGKQRKKISSIRGDVYLESRDSTASLEALEKATNLLDDILEQVKL